MTHPLKTLILFLLALVAFSLLFSGIVFDFWLQMTISVAALCFLAFLLDPDTVRDLLRPPERGWAITVCLGLLSAAALYGIFFAGNVAVRLVLENGQSDIAKIYSLKHDGNAWLIAALIALVIAPGEEIVWRGYLQTQLMKRYGIMGLVLAVVAYGSVHVASGNLVLIAAAMVCGVFWTVLSLTSRSIWMNIVSHIAWDLAVFLLWPFS